LICPRFGILNKKITTASVIAPLLDVSAVSPPRKGNVHRQINYAASVLFPHATVISRTVEAEPPGNLVSECAALQFKQIRVVKQRDARLQYH
jgi:hypothetical protein